jgi:hypothetical protein
VALDAVAPEGARRLENVEADVHRRRAQEAAVGVTEEMEAAHQVLVEDRDLAIEDQDVGAQLRDRSGELAEARGVISTLSRTSSAARSGSRSNLPSANR